MIKGSIETIKAMSNRMNSPAAMIPAESGGGGGDTGIFLVNEEPDPDSPPAGTMLSETAGAIMAAARAGKLVFMQSTRDTYGEDAGEDEDPIGTNIYVVPMTWFAELTDETAISEYGYAYKFVPFDNPQAAYTAMSADEKPKSGDGK